MTVTTTQQTTTMKAMVRERYGSEDVLELKDVPKPELVDDGVLVRVRATSLNFGDWYTMEGRPLFARLMMGLRKPKERLFGGDFAGTVEAVGRDVTGFEPGDEVFGGRNGAFAEYVCARHGIGQKPAHLSFEEAAAVPVAAMTALQALRDKGRIQPGQKVLVNGASGGVGTFAVQIAKAFGAEVTAVCSTHNVDAARSSGADHVVDYTRDDFTRSSERYDVLLDIAGSKSWSKCTRVLAPHGIVVLVGGSKANRLVGPLGHVFRMRLGALRSSRKAVFFIAKFNKEDMETLRELAESGTITPVIDRRYELSELADALRYLGEGHARGKVVVTV
jgi:NADPH:quinone reductase-like Zn-dependent oxidoreductase